MKVCSFFGHRKIVETEELIERIRNAIVNLIENHNVRVFLFGSRSDFDSLCHLIVTELKEQYPEIERRAYTCRSETCTLEKNVHIGKAFILILRRDPSHCLA